MILRQLLKPFVGNSFLIPFYNKLHSLILHLLGYGLGGSIYESGEVYVINKLPVWLNSRSKLVLFDVGANKGDYSKTLIEMLNSKKYDLYSFEPSPRMIEILKNNLQPFTDKKNVHIVPSGLGDKKEQLYLNSNKDNSTIATIFERKLEHWGKEYETNYQELISLTTIDCFCEENKIDHIHFLKMDIEGNELNALVGAQQMIRNKKIDIIQFEFGVSNVDSKTYLKDFYSFFRTNGYSLYRIVNKKLVPINNYKEKLEVFLISNYIAFSPEISINKL